MEEKGVLYDLIVWNRQGIVENNTIAYVSKTKPKSRFSRLLEFYRFQSFIKTKLSENDYTKVIVFSCQMGIILSSFLHKNYNKKYILDIRDYSYVIPYFKRRFNKLIHSAHSVCISSQGFKTWLPNTYEYIISHNLNIKLIGKKTNNLSFQKKFFIQNPIQVDTIGAIRDFDSNFKVMDSLKNNTSFFLNFIGKGYAAPWLEQKAKEMDIKNVSFYGKYKKENENKLLQNTDFINILLDSNFLSDGLTSNRLYLSAMLKIPCLVNSGTEHSRIIKEYGFGIIIEDYEEIPNKLKEYINTFDRIAFIEGCDRFLEKVEQDYLLFQQNMYNFMDEVI